MKKLLLLFLVAVTGLVCVSCDNDDENGARPDLLTGTFVLNNGSWGDNNSNIGVYDPSARSYGGMAFRKANGYGLGDLGQDMLLFGDDLYIAVNGSQTIFVTDRYLKVKDRIDVEHGGSRLSPRYLACTDEKVYVSYYEGFLGEIDPRTHECRLIPVGPNPEGIAVVGTEIYVAESGGLNYPEYNNTVSVVSVEDFSVVRRIEVNLNPVTVAANADGSRAYVFSYGDYDAVPAMLQVIDVATGEVSSTEYQSVSAIAEHGDLLYVLCSGYDAAWNPLPGTIFCHDMATDRAMGEFVTDSTELPSAYSISTASDGYVYVGCSDYKNNGDVFVFTPGGKLHDSFDSQGINPICVL